MDWNRAATDWRHFRYEVRARWPSLSEAQLDGIAGTRSTLAGQLRATYDLTEEQVDSQIRYFETVNLALRAVSLR